LRQIEEKKYYVPYLEKAATYSNIVEYAQPPASPAMNFPKTSQKLM
jgi:hypothetical protein